MKHLQPAGFSLIELMIVLIIMAIISSFAIPYYQQHLRHAHRKQAERQLLEAASSAEQYYTRHKSYKGIELLKHLRNPDYQFNVQALTQQTFTLEAAPIGGQSTDPCGTLSINQWQQKQPEQTGCWG